MIFNTTQNAKKWYPACLENTSIPQLDIEITKILQEKNSNTANPSVPLLGCNNNFFNFHKGSNEIPFSEPLIQTFNIFSIQCYSFHQPLCPFSPTTTPPQKNGIFREKKEYPHSIEVNCSSLQHVRHVLKSPVLVSILNIVGSQPMLVCARLLTSGNVQKSRHLIKSDRNRACKI